MPRVLSAFRSFGAARSLPAVVFVCASGISAHAQQAPQAAPSASAQTAPTPPPPFPNRLNEALPSWLRVRGEFRERIEGVAGSGFVSGRDDGYALSRFRFNATVTPSRLVSMQVQAQDARVADKEIGATGAPFKGAFDLRMAFVDIGTAKSPVRLRVGRQELAYGEQRLVGHVSWLNTARTFDAVRATLKGRNAQVDVFGASVVRIVDKEFDKSGNGNRFFGAYGTLTALVPQASVEPYFFFRGDRALRNEAGTLADLQAATIGVRLAGKLPARFDYNADVAAQTGSLGSDSVGAWAGHWLLRESFPGPRAVKVSAELNLASGDANPTDGKRGTFDQLYPTPHDKYGLADQIGWKNIRHLRTGVDLTPGKKFQLSGNYHSWWLMETRDALHGAGSGVLVGVPTGAVSSAHVGQELDVQVMRPITPQLQLAGGLAHIIPGGFLKQATPGASYTFPYIMATYVFLADR